MTVKELIQELYKQVEEGNGDKKIILSTQEGYRCTMASRTFDVFENAGQQVTIFATDRER